MKKLMQALGQCHPSKCPTCKQQVISWVVIGIIVLGILFFVFGCESSGFDKRATLMPDSITVTYGQQRFREEAAAYRGFTIGATWNFD